MSDKDKETKTKTMESTEAIKKYMADWGGDGHSILKAEALPKYGFSEDFINDNSYDHSSGRSYKDTIFDGRGNKMASCMGVYSLSFAYALASNIGADTSKAHEKIGRGFQASELHTAIMKRIKEIEDI